MLNPKEKNMEKKSEKSRIAYNKMALEYDSSPEGSYTRPHKAELIKKLLLKMEIPS